MKEKETKPKSLYEVMEDEELHDFIEGLEIELIKAKDAYIKRFIPKNDKPEPINPPTWKWL